MSHFTVLIVGNDPEEQLQPFAENGNGQCREEYLTFVEAETQYLAEYNEKSSECLKMPDGSLRSIYDTEFHHCWKRSDGSVPLGISSDATFTPPPGTSVVTVPHKERYSSFEEYMDKYCGFSERDPEKDCTAIGRIQMVNGIGTN